MVEETITFLRQWISISSEQNLRLDYQELAIISFLFLDTAKTSSLGIVVKAPAAIHNVHCMAN